MMKSHHVMKEQYTKMRTNQRHIQAKKQKDYERNFNRWRDFDLLTSLISTISLALAIVTYEYAIQ